MLRFTILALLVAVAAAGKIEFTNCGSLGVVVSVDVEDCDELPCELVKGRAYKLEVVFQPHASSTGLTVIVVGKVSVITIPILEKDGCEGLSTGCPYQGSLLNNHKITINIAEDLVETEARVEYRLRNAAGAGEVCISAPVRIVAEPSC